MPPAEDRQRLLAIIETAIDGIITIDEGGIMDTVNPAAAELFGYERDELIGKNVSTLMPEPYRSQHDGYLSNYLQGGEGKIIGVGREVLGMKKSGETFPFRLAVGEVHLVGDKRIFTGIIHDLTREKRNAERMKQYAADLERSNQELENFAYISSHDLQEPLRKIQAFGSRIMDREGDKLSTHGQDYLNRMLNASSRLQRLIDDLLTFSRLSSRACPFERVDLNRVLAEVHSDLEIAIQEAEATLEIGALPQIEADPTQMHQLFQNLIGNAIKFREEGRPPVIQVKAESFEQEPNEAGGQNRTMHQIQVVDNGIGFEEKYLDKIFNIFQRLEGRRYPGSGIGLAICRKIALRHGGNLTAYSRSDEGAKFTVTLPAIQEEVSHM